jgi:L-aminopeptidase/D-esterase-like protein
VPAAILFDLGVGGRSDVRPGPDCGYQAAVSATSAVIAEGSVGAGAGATVGKLAGRARAMKGGIGTASFTADGGLVVAALVAVNAVGTVFDRRTGRPVAGVRTPDGQSLENPWTLASRTASSEGAAPLQNTTIGVVATNARLSKAQALRLSEMAHDGLARAIVPSHTQADGDTLFAVATGSLDGEADLGLIGRLAAEAVSDAVLRAVQLATAVPGFPAASDLR